MTAPIHSITEQSPAEKADALNTLRSQLLDRKQVLNMRIIEIKASLIKTLPRDQYYPLERERQKLIRDVMEIDRQIAPMKLQIKALNMHVSANGDKPKNEPREQTLEWKRSIVEQLVTIRGEYQAFAADHSRISSRRAMASEFVVKLNAVIKSAMNRDA